MSSSATSVPAEPTREKLSLLGRISTSPVYVFEKAIPDPYVFAVGLTLLTSVLALALTPNTTIGSIGVAWYNGVFNIFTFAFQMVLILVTGYALASSPAVHSVLERLASIPKTPRDAVSLTIVIGMLASWTNWGFGLVTAGLLAREIAKRVRIDFGWLVAAAYTGFVISTEGLSGSIALSQATPGSVLNLVEKTTGHGLPLTQTIFTRFNLIPILALLVLLPIIFRYTQPAEADSAVVDPERLKAEDKGKKTVERRGTLGSWLDHAWILNLLLFAVGSVGLAQHWRQTGFSFDINSVILIFLLLGLLFHWRPIAYVDAVKNAARVTGPEASAIQVTVDTYGHLISGANGCFVDWFDAVRAKKAEMTPLQSATSGQQGGIEVPPDLLQVIERTGGGGWTRTNDLRIMRASL